MNTEEKRKQRKKQTAEDFTPEFLVNEILDKLNQYSPEAFKNENKTFCDPACGNGNFLIQILKKKIENNHDPLKAISTIYGCDIMEDNIKECRRRLLDFIMGRFQDKLEDDIYIKIINTLFSNIVYVPLAKYPNGSLDYLSLPDNKQFDGKMKKGSAEKILKKN